MLLCFATTSLAHASYLTSIIHAFVILHDDSATSKPSEPLSPTKRIETSERTRSRRLEYLELRHDGLRDKDRSQVPSLSIEEICASQVHTRCRGCSLLLVNFFAERALLLVVAVVMLIDDICGGVEVR